jgi:predicted signal transduction protein with EAL and GGDEF domain
VSHLQPPCLQARRAPAVELAPHSGARDRRCLTINCGQHRMGTPYQIHHNKVRIGISVGIAIAPRDGLELEKLTACADAALYMAKRDGKGRVMLWAGPTQEDLSVAV